VKQRRAVCHQEEVEPAKREGEAPAEPLSRCVPIGRAASKELSPKLIVHNTAEEAPHASSLRPSAKSAVLTLPLEMDGKRQTGRKQAEGTLVAAFSGGRGFAEPRMSMESQ